MSKLELLDFIATEATHDNFYNMTDLIDPKKGGIDLKNIIDQLANNCDLVTQQKNKTPNVPYKSIIPSNEFKNSFFSKNIGITEFEMDEVLLGKKRHLLCLTHKKWDTIKVRSLDYFTMEVSDKDAEIKHFPQISCNKKDTTMINDMFKNVKAKINKKDIYFVCDSASEVIGKFSITSHFPNDINIHMMISSSTLSDPSSRITRNSRHPISVPKKGNKYIHTYENEINLKICDKFGLLDFSINHSLTGIGPDYSVSEIFEYSSKGSSQPNHPIPLKRTLNPANLQTGKPALQCEIGTGRTIQSQCGKIYSKPAKSPFYMDMRRGLRIAQYKRMGDHQQIRFVRWLWDKKNFMSKQELYDSKRQQKMQTNQIKNFVPPSPKNTFFVTGDYPAFNYAVFHRINAIIKTASTNGSSRGLLMVTFK